MALRPSLRPLTPAPGDNTVAGLGCAPIGNLYTPVADDDAVATVREALRLGIRFFDTAPHYGAGASERRLGLGLQGFPRDQVVIASKVGRAVVGADGRPAPAGSLGADTVADLSRDGVWRSVEGSLRRLGTDRLDLLHLHDAMDVVAALEGAMVGLTELREQGVVRAISIGMVRTAPLIRYVREASPDVIMEAGRLTLIDRSADDELLPLARARGIGILAAGVFNSGVLADPQGSPLFDYYPAEPRLVSEALAMERVCREFGVELRHAATRFPLLIDGVEAVVVGARTPDEVRDFVEGLEVDLPEALWPALDAVHAATVTA